jgi:hypothetical protein
VQDINTYFHSFADSHAASLTTFAELLDDFIAAPVLGDDADDFRDLATLIQQQPFAPAYAASSSPHAAHLSSLLADEPEQEQVAFLLRLLQARAP